MSDQLPAPGAGFRPGHLAEHPLPPGIVGALGLSGYQLLVDIAGVGAGRLGSHVFLLVAGDPDPAGADAGTQIALHQSRLRDDAEAAAFAQLAAELGYLRLSGYRVLPVRSGLRSKVNVVDPGSGAIVVTIPERHPGRLFGGGMTAARLVPAVRNLPAAGPPPDTQSPELLRQALLALALRDDSLGGAEAANLADRALELAQADRSLDPPAALAAAKREDGPASPVGD
ncbi:MAG TPA: hypothetical protein VMD09_12175 [Solirubrobacteraceae bacterium]|nr:hypothetical protein [Solirubrobacteraceae bacterium]